MRALKSDERTLWRETMRGVKPLRDTPAEMGKPPRRKVAVPRNAVPETSPPVKNEPKAIAPLDRRSAQRLKRGTAAIEARLDLHGMTQSEAHAALSRFLARAQAQERRLVLVITGKSGVLHGAVPRWLHEEPCRGHVLAVSRAHVPHGGEGALYVKLRRKR
jgi:DNA-nicking Smr family endonuclease